MNHAISDIQPAGSTYKLVTGTGVLAARPFKRRYAAMRVRTSASRTGLDGPRFEAPLAAPS